MDVFIFACLLSRSGSAHTTSQHISRGSELISGRIKDAEQDGTKCLKLLNTSRRSVKLFTWEALGDINYTTGTWKGRGMD